MGFPILFCLVFIQVVHICEKFFKKRIVYVDTKYFFYYVPSLPKIKLVLNGTREKSIKHLKIRDLLSLNKTLYAINIVKN